MPRYTRLTPDREARCTPYPAPLPVRGTIYLLQVTRQEPAHSRTCRPGYRPAGPIPIVLLASLCAATLLHSRPADGSGGMTGRNDQVRFPPGQDATVPVGTLVPVVAANMQGDSPVASVNTYLPAIPPGLEVYADPLKTVLVAAGMTVSTHADGRDTLWVTCRADATADQAFMLSIPGTGTSVMLTFRLPPLGLREATASALPDPDVLTNREYRDILGRSQKKKASLVVQYHSLGEKKGTWRFGGAASP